MDRIKQAFREGCPKCGQNDDFKVFSKAVIYQWVDLNADGEIEWGTSERGDWEDELMFIRCPDCRWQEDL